MTNITDDFVSFLYTLSANPLPDKVFLQAKRCLLDYLGVALAGSTMIGNRAASFLEGALFDGGKVRAIGLVQKTSLANAAFLNGVSSHWPELDDGHRFAMGHPGSPVISALIPVSQAYGLPAKNFFKGLVVGYQAMIILARSIQPRHKLVGFHATGTCGTIGSAVAIAVALGFNKEQIKNTISASATGASGLLAVIENYSELKPFNSGKAALNGYFAAQMGFAGFKGPADVLGGERGFLQVFSGGEYLPLEKFYADEVNNYAIEEVYFKPYAACRHAHAPITAVLSLRTRYGLDVSQIESITVKTYDLAIKSHDHSEVVGVNSARMSIPFSVAVAAIRGTAGVEDFTGDAIVCPTILGLAKRVKVLSDPEFSQMVPQCRPALVDVILKNGEVISEYVEHAKGEPENPLSDEELVDKFISLALLSGWGSEKVDEIAKRVMGNEEDMSHLFNLL